MKNSKCVSIMPDGTQTIFTPKKKEPRTRVEKINGKLVIIKKERALQ